MHPAIYRLIISAKQVPLHVNQHLNRRVHVSFGAVMLAGTLALNVAAQQQTSPIPDAQVELNVLRALTSSPELSNQNIQSATVNGVVTLTGSTNDEASRTKAEELVAHALGVKKVVDGLTVGHRTLTVTQAQDALAQTKAQAKEDQKSLPNCRPLSGPDLSQCNHAWAAQLSASNKRVADAQKAVYEAQAEATRQEQAQQRAEYEASHPKATSSVAKPAPSQQQQSANRGSAIAPVAAAEKPAGGEFPIAKKSILTAEDAPSGLGFLYRHTSPTPYKDAAHDIMLCINTLAFEMEDLAGKYDSASPEGKLNALYVQKYFTMSLNFLFAIDWAVDSKDLSKSESDQLEKNTHAELKEMFANRELVQKRVPYCGSLHTALGLDHFDNTSGKNIP
jgi:hypothetical protein